MEIKFEDDEFFYQNSYGRYIFTIDKARLQIYFNGILELGTFEQSSIANNFDTWNFFKIKDPDKLMHKAVEKCIKLMILK